jgi:2Fe-2S ferredoxin
MANITFIEPSGKERIVDVPLGWSLMQAATSKGVDGIEAECGGSCACATCHCYVEGDLASKVPAPAQGEISMLDCVVAERRPNSRLSCQIKMTAALEGLIVRLPDEQS